MLFHVVEIEKADFTELSSVFSLLRKTIATEKERVESIGKKPLSTVTEEESQIYQRHRLLKNLQLHIITRMNTMADQVDLKEVFK